MSTAPEDVQSRVAAANHVGRLIDMTRKFALAHELITIHKPDSLGSGVIVFGEDVMTPIGRAFGVVAGYAYKADESGIAGNLRQIIEFDDAMEPSEFGDVVPFDLHSEQAMVEMMMHIDTQFHEDDECPAGDS